MVWRRRKLGVKIEKTSLSPSFSAIFLSLSLRHFNHQLSSLPACPPPAPLQVTSITTSRPPHMRSPLSPLPTSPTCWRFLFLPPTTNASHWLLHQCYYTSTFPQVASHSSFIMAAAAATPADQQSPPFWFLLSPTPVVIVVAPPKLSKLPPLFFFFPSSPANHYI